MEFAHGDLRFATGAMSGGNSGVNSLYMLTYPARPVVDEAGSERLREAENFALYYGCFGHFFFSKL